ncbi:MAG: hypothetical protein ISS02_01210 [Candidatus Portnoybacteria bacterium]|nr:hypothetical protein [Candidatus Portnoybacteria bacterium]
MNKKIYTILFLIIIIIIGGYYYLYYQSPIIQDGQNEQEVQEQQDDTSQSDQLNQDEILNDNEYSDVVKNVIDGVFQKAENNLIYVQVKDEDLIKAIKLTDDTSFSRMNFSSKIELINEIDITLSDLVEGDQISVVAFYEECDNENECSGDMIASTVRQINVEIEVE